MAINLTPTDTEHRIINGQVIMTTGDQSSVAAKDSRMIIDHLEIRTAGFVTGGKSVQSTLEATNSNGMILKSPNNKRWFVQVSNTGSLSAVEIV